MVFSIIQKSQLEGANRLDAEYYQPEYLDIYKKLNTLKTEPLGNLSFSIKKGIFDLSPDNYRDSGIPFLRTTEIKDPLLETSSMVFLDTVTHNKYHGTTLKTYDVVFTKIGASIGDVALVPERFQECNFSQNVAGVRLKEGSINPRYLLAFLLSKFGKQQILRSQMISGQGKLELSDLRRLKIPTMSKEMQEGVASIISQSQKLKDFANDYYFQAEDLLLEELELKDFQTPEDLSFIVNFSEVKNANRIDTDYFQPKCDALISHFKNIAKPLISITSRRSEDIEIDPKKEYKYIEISDVNVGNGEVISNSILGRGLPANAKMKIDGSELIVSKVRPTRGAIAIIPDEWNENFVASGAFSIFKCNSPLKEYLQVVLRSIIGRLQMEKPTTGTSYPIVTDQDIESILIPVLPKPIQQKIAVLVRKSHEARKKSKEFLEEAKRKIEEMVEKGGEK